MRDRLELTKKYNITSRGLIEIKVISYVLRFLGMAVDPHETIISRGDCIEHFYEPATVIPICNPYLKRVSFNAVAEV